VNKKRNTRTWIIYGVLLLVLITLLSSQLFNGFLNREEREELSTNQFISLLKNEQMIDVTYNVSSATLTGSYVEKKGDPAEQATLFTSTYVGEDSLNEMMARYPDTEYKVNVDNPNAWISALSYVLPLLLFGGLIWFMFSQFNSANNKQMQFGKTKAKKAHEERPTTKFTDVAGIDEAVEELQEIKEFLTNPQRFIDLGAKIPRGVLLVGPPGTGKTLLARAVAGEAGVPFFSISGSDFVEMFVGVGASRVRDLFEQAKQSAPAIIFIDEIDAVGRQRGAGLGGGHDEREQTLNQLLVEMDGFDDHQSVILIAATNRVDILDPALLRPGRFDRQIVVMRPDLKGREQILKVHAEGKPLAHSVELERLARMTPGFTGADLANLMNEAALLTARKGKKLVTMNELEEAMEREIAGPERKSRIMTEKEKRTIAYHESGHALVGHILENSDPVHKISIISRGQALGYTLSLPSEDRFLSSRNEMYDDLAVFMGGRVAEEIFCDDITTGASNDLERATKMARQMVTRYGMTEALGSQVYGEANHEVFLGRDYAATPDYSEATAQRIDEEVARIMAKAHDVAYQTLTERTAQIELMANVLIDRETVEGQALEALLNNSWNEYLEHEDEILAKRAEEERKQIEEDERHAAEERERKAQLAAAEGLPEQAAGVAPQTRQELTLEDIFSGKVDLEELVQKRLGLGAGAEQQQEATDTRPGSIDVQQSGADAQNWPPPGQAPAQASVQDSAQDFAQDPARESAWESVQTLEPSTPAAETAAETAVPAVPAVAAETAVSATAAETAASAAAAELTAKAKPKTARKPRTKKETVSSAKGAASKTTKAHNVDKATIEGAIDDAANASDTDNDSDDNNTNDINKSDNTDKPSRHSKTKKKP
jgi:cell division protease FtsH